MNLNATTDDDELVSRHPIAATVLGALAGVLVAGLLTYVWLHLYGEARPVANGVTDRERAALSAILIGAALGTVVISTAVAAFVTARSRGHTAGAASLIFLASISFEAVVVNLASFDNFC